MMINLEQEKKLEKKAHHHQQQQRQPQLLLSSHLNEPTSSYLCFSEEDEGNKENVTAAASSPKEVKLTHHTELFYHKECHKPQAIIPDYTYQAALSAWSAPTDDSQTLTCVTYLLPSDYNNQLFILLIEMLHDCHHTCIQEINFQKVLGHVLQHCLHLILPRTFAVLLKVLAVILNCNKCNEKVEAAGHVFKSWDIFVHHLSIFLQLHANSPQDLSTILSIATGLKIFSKNLRHTVTVLSMTDIINFYTTVKNFCSPDIKKECINHLESLKVKIPNDDDEEEERDDNYDEHDDSSSIGTYYSVGSVFL